MRLRIKHYKKLASTNTTAKRLAQQGAKEGLVVTADYQTQGRGRLGRKWISPANKNLLFSLVIRPEMKAHAAPIITQIVCRSVASVLRTHYQIGSTFKPPNDILVHGKKICGILVETSTASERKVEPIIIGIGLNVNSPEKDLFPTATSMKEISGKECDREKLLRTILEQIRTDLRSVYAHRT